MSFEVCSSAATGEVKFSDGVYGCDAAWATPGVASAEHFCGSNYHICTSLQDVQSNGLTDCENTAPNGKAYLT